MATTSTRLTTATYFVNGIFDEVTFNTTTPDVVNLTAYSQDFTQPYWSKFNCSVIGNAYTAPDGTRTAGAFVDTADTVTTFHTLSKTITGLTTNTYYTLSVYAATSSTSGSVTSFELSSKSGSGSNFNLATRAVNFNYGIGFNPTITDAGNGWVRLSTTVLMSATSAAVVILPSYTGIGTSYTGTGVTTTYLWGIQYEKASTATIYQPIGTTGTVLNTGVVSKITTNTVYVSNIFDEVTFNATTPTIVNLLPTSEDFSPWGVNTAPNSATIVTNAIAAPNGTLTADFILKAVTTGSSTVYRTYTGSTSTAYVGSMYVKAGGYTRAQVYFGNSAFNNLSYGGYVNLTNGSVISIQNSSTVTVTDAGTGWYRIAVTATSDADGGNYVFAVQPADNTNNTVFAGDGVSGIYVWGAQVEVGTTATIYQPKSATSTLLASSTARKIDNTGITYISGIYDEVTGI